MLPDYEKMGAFYLGKEDDELLMYDSRHLLTHGVVIGMTGSGKTGLSITILEEAALDGVPAIVIDPKGDLSNLLLTFPELRAEDFAPWVPEGKDPQVEADIWKAGLAEWGQDGARIARLREAVDIKLYTPGSKAGTPVSFIKSLELPPAAILEDEEVLRERIVAVVSSLLGLVGADADPVKSREHVLLSRIVHDTWNAGKSLDLGLLIQRIQDPRVNKIGVLDLESFFPEKARFELASTFNNLLASPGFATWLEGDALDIDTFLRAPGIDGKGKPRISIFSIAHLGDQERMFFVTLLLHQMVGWMRSQSGTTSLRALLYMDEIFGFFPPVANPPSKMPLLTLLKQARAFGLGVLLATQNPVDLDYKGLSNAGTWFIGRLQTERDKARVVEGLLSAAGSRPVDQSGLDRLLSSLEKRQFLLHDVHDADGPRLLRTRFTLSYLRGPLTREQLKGFKQGRPKERAPSLVPAPTSARAVATETSAIPVVAKEITQVVLGEGPYVPCLLGVADVTISDTKAGIDVARTVAFLIPFREGALPVDWDSAQFYGGDVAGLPSRASDDARAEALPDVALKAKSYATWTKEFSAWLFANQGVSRFKSPSSGLLSEPNESESAFRARIELAAREARDRALDALRAKYDPKFAQLKEKIRTEAQALEEATAAEKAQGQANTFAIGASLVGAIFGRTSVSKIARGVSQAARAKGQSEKASERTLDAAFQEEAQALAQKLDAANEALERVTAKPKKAGIRVMLFALAWNTPASA
jgi:Helicase HerA, central domain